MGSDIFGYLEIRAKNTLKWEERIPIPCERCYNMFGLLNGFRNNINIPPISESRGFPEDLSPFVEKIINDEDDIVAPSHLYWEDFEKYDLNQKIRINSKQTLVYDTKTGELIKSKFITPPQIIYKCGWEGFLLIMKDLAKLYGSKNVRIIFWYDN